MALEGKIVGVSLGPGDPDLITVKGLNALRAADKVYFPGTLFVRDSSLEQSSNKSPKKSSYSEGILSHYNLPPEKLEGFYLEMSLDRTAANKVYDQTAEKILEEYKQGKNIAIVCEGDLSTFSSFSYLLERFQKTNTEVELIPGITSFGLGAALTETPLAIQQEKIIVLPAVQSEREIEDALNSEATVVLMKIRSVMSIIKTMASKENIELKYCERLGTPDQFISKKWEEIAKRTPPYFSLIILRKCK